MILVLRINLHYKYTFVTRYFDETADPMHKCLSLVVKRRVKVVKNIKNNREQNVTTSWQQENVQSKYQNVDKTRTRVRLWQAVASLRKHP